MSMRRFRPLFAVCCSTLLVTVCLQLFQGCSSTPPLTDEEMAKLHPQVQRLLAGDSVPELEEASSLLADGSRAYELIVRTTAADELRSIGISPQSQFGEFLTVRVTTEEIVKLARLPSLIAIDPGSKNYPQ